MSSLTVIIPALNEDKNIESAVQNALESAGKYFQDVEILVFNDGSADKTGEIADSLGKKDLRIKVTHHDRPKNLGGCYKEGIGAASKEYVIMIPGDNECGSDVMQKVFSLVGSADMIIPYTANLGVRPWFRQALSRAYTGVINLISGSKLRYYNGAVLHKTEFVKSCSISTDSFAYQAETLVKLLRQGRTYKEVPVEITYRQDGVSKALKPKNIWTVLKSTFYLFFQVRLKGAWGPATGQKI